ncbi:hypothetical protein [Sulfobacillus sp. hq2]|uniref:hypothetical protein n=1 Tax=Sulfobacillus TaxID=28033 RepID=UPI000CD168A7|nr:hypothetical protein [Sulfobacillus sp. hq2]POB10450.1 hypothetical protein CO251_10965 [Sulfobacillus sp. hq2]
MIIRHNGLVGAAILLGSIVLTGCGTTAPPVASALPPHSHTVSPAPSTSPRSSRPMSPSPTSSPAALRASTPAAPLSYVTYHNSIWGYSVAVPQSFTESGPVEDRDGRSWSSGSVNIVVYGEYSNAMGHIETVTSALSTLDHQKHPAYQAHGSDWLVVSGIHGSQIYYTKEFIGSTHRDVLSISYPAIDKNHWSSIVSAVSRSFTPGELSNVTPAPGLFQTQRVTIPPSITVQLEVPSGWTKQRWSAGDAGGFVWVNPLNSAEWVRMLFSGNAGALLNNQGHYDVTQFINNPGVQWRVIQATQLSGQFTIPIGGISIPIGNINFNKYVVYGYAAVITRPSPLGVEIDAVAPKTVAKVISTSVIIR